MHFTLVKLTSAENPASPANGFDDVMLPIRYALSRLGYAVETRINAINPHSVNILFGVCQLAPSHDFSPPSNSIVFNLEQIGSPWIGKPEYLAHLRRYTVWEYSRRNARYFRKSLGMDNVVEVRLGYVPEMTRLIRDVPRDIDVLFYGAVNERRRKALEAIRGTTPRLAVLQGGYGARRDAFIARSKLVVNIHYYVPATLEVPRLGYLWANHRAVVSEFASHTERDPGLDNACRFCSYDDLPSVAAEMIRSDSAREEQAEKAFTAFSALRQEDILEAVVGRRVHTVSRIAGPGRHTGSIHCAPCACAPETLCSPHPTAWSIS